MGDTLDVTAPVSSRKGPPPWPEPGTPEYEARLAKMRAGHQKRLLAQQQSKREAPTAEPELIDTGRPKPVRMAPESDEKPKAKAGSSRSKDSEIDEPKVREYLKLAFDYLASRPGADHWQRDDEEIALISVPGTRCYNRLDKKLREQLQAISDPAALIFGCCVVVGPSLMREVQNVQNRKQAGVSGRAESSRAPQPPQRPQQPASATAAGFGGDDFPGASPIPRNGTASPAPVPDLPSIGI